MTPDALLSMLASHLGLPRLFFNEDGACAVRLADKVDLNMQVLPSAEEVRWTLPLGQPDPAHVVPLLLEGLVANTTLAGTTSRHLSWEMPTERIVLCQTLRFDEISPATLGPDLDAFIATCRSLIEELQRNGVFQTSKTN